MEFDKFLEIFSGAMAIELNAVRLVWSGRASGIAVALHRWQEQGRLLRLKNGLYLFSEKYRKVEPFEPHIAWLMKNPSYISLEKALELHHLIPEAIPPYTSLTTRPRPALFATPVGRFRYFSFRPAHFWGYRTVERNGYRGYLAEPEKALLDMFYFRDGPITAEYLGGMRLQNLDAVNRKKLIAYAKKFGKSKIMEGGKNLLKWMENNGEG